MNRRHRTIHSVRTGLLGAAAAGLAVVIIAYPAETFQASLSGLKMWWDIVLPALLPFLILSELLLGFGVIHAVGAMLEPLMRTLFRLPGAGGWTVAMSLAAGFPAGAKAAADLRRAGTIGRREGERLAAISHVCSPIFLTGVVAAGFWRRPELGLPLVAAHVISAFLTGLIVSRLPSAGPADASGNEPRPPKAASAASFAGTIRGAAEAMAAARREDGRPLGRLLGDAVASAMQTLLAVGGFIIIFAVLVQVLSSVGLALELRLLLETLLASVGLPVSLANGALISLFELHLGAYHIAHSGEASVWEAALLNAAIGWGGLCLHAQAQSVLSGTDLRYTRFLYARIVHAAVSLLVTLALWDTLLRWFGNVVPAFAAAPARLFAEDGGIPGWAYWLPSAGLMIGFLAAAAAAAAVLGVLRRLFFRL